MYIIDMKKIACLFFCLILCSCGYEEYHGCAAGKQVAMKSSSEESDNSDDWDGCAGPPPPPDNTKPSSEELWFNAEGGIDSVTTEGENWYMDTSYDIMTNKEIIISYVDGEMIKIETSWFTVYKSNKKKIIFSVNKNETGNERAFSIILIGNHYYYIHINVKQSAE